MGDHQKSTCLFQMFQYQVMDDMVIQVIDVTVILGCPLELGKRLKRQRYISHLVPNFTYCFNLVSFQPVMATPISDTRGITFLESPSSRALPAEPKLMAPGGAAMSLRFLLPISLRNILRKLYMIYKSNQRKTLVKPPDCFVQIVQAGWPLEWSPQIP